MSYFLQLFKKDIVPKPITPSIPRELKPFSLKKGMVGVDISHHNREVDLKVLCDHVDFVYMKATEGTSFVSKTYEQRAKELNEIGKPWGAYHYYRVKNSPEDQAKHFLNYIDKESGLAPVLDIEAINNNFKSPHHTEDLLTFLSMVEKETGLMPIVYTSYYYARDVIKTDERFKKYPLWLAWYTNDFAKVKCPNPWGDVKIWQFTEKGNITGVTGNVDINKVMS